MGKSQLVQRFYTAEPRARGGSRKVTSCDCFWLEGFSLPPTLPHPSKLSLIPPTLKRAVLWREGVVWVGGWLCCLCQQQSECWWMSAQITCDWSHTVCLPSKFTARVSMRLFRGYIHGRWEMSRATKNLSQFWQMHRCCFRVNALSKCVFSRPIDKEGNIPSAPL